MNEEEGRNEFRDLFVRFREFLLNWGWAILCVLIVTIIIFYYLFYAHDILPYTCLAEHLCENIGFEYQGRDMNNVFCGEYIGDDVYATHTLYVENWHTLIFKFPECKK